MNHRQFVVGFLFTIALIVLLCLLVIAQVVKSVGLGEQAVGIIGIDSNGKLAALDGIGIDLVHKLGGGQRIPVVFGKGIRVDKLVEQPLGVLVFPKAEKCACHQLLEVG